MKILLFGKDGQVGSQLNKLLAAHDQLVALDINELDLTDLQAVDAIVQKTSPDWVINAAAYTAVDRAETESELAETLNARAPAVMAKACAAIGASMLHYSTDYVFDGTATRPYVETDETNPKSVYGRTKLNGEQAVMQVLPAAVILRTAWVYARNGSNFVNTMLNLSKKMKSIKVVEDQYGSPTLADDLASASIRIIEMINTEKTNDVYGIYHATGSGKTNWSGFAQAVFKLKGFDDVHVQPIPSSDYPTPAARPAWSVLSNEKLKNTFNIELPHWRDGLPRCLNVSL